MTLYKQKERIWREVKGYRSLGTKEEMPASKMRKERGMHNRWGGWCQECVQMMNE